MADPCTRPLLGSSVITEPTRVPLCRTSVGSRPVFDDGVPRSRQGIDGTTRYACLFTPDGGSPSSPRPLLIWFHGSGGLADGTYDSTGLRAKAESYDLTGDSARPGYSLLSIQGRNLHWPTITNEDGTKHDLYFRDFSSPSTNPDFENVDAWIDALVDAGVVDTSRIFVSGWSNGARFAQSYAIARHDAGTPGGQHVRAAAVYSGTDPFNTPNPSLSPTCQSASYPQSNVPIYVTSRACDILPCNEAHAAAFVDAGTDVTPGDVMQTWVSDLSSRVGAAVTWQRLSGLGGEVGACASSCTANLGLANHLNWPDAAEPAMLDFLRNAPP